MRKVWVSTRKGIPGQYVEWYDSQNRRRSKYFAPQYRTYVKQFKARKFMELNGELRPVGDVMDVAWCDFVAIYKERQRARGVSAADTMQLNYTIKYFEEYCHPAGTAQINERMLNHFAQKLLERPTTRPKSGQKTMSRHTVNTRLRYLRAMLIFGQEHGYIRKCTIRPVKAPKKILRSLSNTEIKRLIKACNDDRQWRMRILLAICTGLRRGDIDDLTLRCIDVEHKTITLREQKTGKITMRQPLPDALMPELHQFLLDEVSTGQVRVFKYTSRSTKWRTLRERAKLTDITFHDLRRTFGSLQADAGVPIKALQEMYLHSSIETTMNHYITTDDAEKRKGVNTLEMDKWF